MKNRFNTFIRKYDNQVVSKVGSQLSHLGIVIAIVLLLGSLASCRLGSTSRWKMNGNSMEPNLKDGQVLGAEPVDDLSSIHRGDIIIFERDESSMIKRLVALPGETIEIRQGNILINGEVYDEPYEVIAPDYERESITLGKDEYYVLGDNRNESQDSHEFGPITSEMIKNRVLP